MIKGLSQSHFDWLKKFYRTRECTCIDSGKVLQVDHDITIGKNKNGNLKVLEHKTERKFICKICSGVKNEK